MSAKSFLDHVGHDLKTGLDFILPWAAGAGSLAVAAFAPGLGPLFNSTVAAVTLAEQKSAVLGAVKNGPAKMADVLQIMEPVIAQGLKDSGQDATTAGVMKYVNGVVMFLKAAPAPAVAGVIAS
jgi:hypothetical protein